MNARPGLTGGRSWSNGELFRPDMFLFYFFFCSKVLGRLQQGLIEKGRPLVLLGPAAPAGPSLVPKWPSQSPCKHELVQFSLHRPFPRLTSGVCLSGCSGLVTFNFEREAGKSRHGLLQGSLGSRPDPWKPFFSCSKNALLKQSTDEPFLLHTYPRRYVTTSPIADWHLG